MTILFEFAKWKLADEDMNDAIDALKEIYDVNAKPEDFLCHGCPRMEHCGCRWDLYNHDPSGTDVCLVDK